MQIMELEKTKDKHESVSAELERITAENEDLRTDLLRCESELEQHKISSKEKLRFAEHELEESRLQLQQHRRSAANEQREFKLIVERKEEEFKRGIDEANDVCREQKIASEEAMRR